MAFRTILENYLKQEENDDLKGAEKSKEEWLKLRSEMTNRPLYEEHSILIKLGDTLTQKDTPKKFSQDLEDAFNRNLLKIKNEMNIVKKSKQAKEAEWIREKLPLTKIKTDSLVLKKTGKARNSVLYQDSLSYDYLTKKKTQKRKRSSLIPTQGGKKKRRKTRKKRRKSHNKTKRKRKSRKHKGGVETRFQKAKVNFSRKKAAERMSILQINREWAKVVKKRKWEQYIQLPPSNPQEGGRRKKLDVKRRAKKR